MVRASKIFICNGTAYSRKTTKAAAATAATPKQYTASRITNNTSWYYHFRRTKYGAHFRIETFNLNWHGAKFDNIFRHVFVRRYFINDASYDYSKTRENCMYTYMLLATLEWNLLWIIIKAFTTNWAAACCARVNEWIGEIDNIAMKL